MSAALKEAEPSGRILTGRMVLAMVVAFFAVVVGANLIMARYAIQTFRGVTNSHAYTDGLAYNKQIEAAHAQDALGWRVKGALTRVAPGRTRVTVTQTDAQGLPTADAQVEVQFQYPVDRTRNRTLALTMRQPGLFTGEIEIEAGHWGLVLRMAQNGQMVFQSQNRVEISDRAP